MIPLIMITPYKAVVFSSNDAFAGVMLRGLLDCPEFHVEKVYLEKKRMGKNSSARIFLNVVKSSGWRYALYQALELVLYSVLINLLKLTGMAKVLTPAAMCARSGIPCGEIDASIQGRGFDPANEYDVLFCFRFSKILKGSMLSIAKVASINFHGSLLPKYAGLGSIFQAIRHNEPEIGGSFHCMVEKIDGGAVIAQSRFPIDYAHSVSYHHLRVYYESSRLFGLLAENVRKNVRVSTNSTEEQYYSFPDKKDVADFKGSFLSPRDFILAWNLFRDYKF